MATKSSTSDELFLLDSKADLQQHLLKMLGAGRKDIAIFSHSLDADLFNNSQIAADISAIARSSRCASIRIVIENSQALIDNNHKLLTLAQRLVSKISIKKLIITPQDTYQFMIIDQDKLWLQHNKEDYAGFANYDARPEVKRFLILFNDLWKHSEEDPRLRSLLV